MDIQTLNKSIREKSLKKLENKTARNYQLAGQVKIYSTLEREMQFS